MAYAPTGQGANALVPLGMRAMSIEFTDTHRDRRFVKPGDDVDLVVTLEKPGSANETHTLLQAVPVLSVSQPAPATTMVTFVLSPEATQQVVYAERMGTVGVRLDGNVCEGSWAHEAIQNPCSNPTPPGPRTRKPQATAPTATDAVVPPSHTPTNFVMLDDRYPTGRGSRGLDR